MMDGRVASPSTRDPEPDLNRTVMNDLFEYHARKDFDPARPLAERMRPRSLSEFVGRVPVITTLHDLVKDDLVQILTKPKNAITRQFQELMAMDTIELAFEDEALEEIAELAMKRKTGARGLRSIIEKLMMKVMYEAPSADGLERVAITKSDVEAGCVEIPECAPPVDKSKRSLDELIEEAS